MLGFLCENMATVLICLAVAASCFAAVWRAVRRRGSCSDCGQSADCPFACAQLKQKKSGQRGFDSGSNRCYSKKN